MRKCIFSAFILIFSFQFIQITAQSRSSYDNLVKSNAFISSGEFIKARECLIKILNSKEPLSKEYLRIIYNNLGAADMSLGKYNDAIYYYNQAEKVILSDKNSFNYLADVYINTGQVNSFRRSYNEAIEYFEKGIRIYSAIKNPDKQILQNISTAYLNMGIAYYSVKDYKKAEEYLLLSAGMKSRYDLPEKALTTLNLAKVAAKKGEYAIAGNYFKKCINEFNTEWGPGYFRLTSVFFDYGMFLSSTGKEDDSYSYFKKALDLSLKTYPEKHPVITLSYKHLGDHFLKKKDYKEALSFYQKSIISGVSYFNDEDWMNNPSLDSLLIVSDLPQCLQGKSEALLQYALQQNDPEYREKLLGKSLETAELIIGLIENIRNSFLSEESRIYLAENEKEIYFKAISINEQLYNLTHDSSFVTRMYETVLRAKSAILRQEIEENNNLFSGSLPDSIQRKLVSLNTDIASYRNLIFNEEQRISPDRKKIDKWKDEVFSMNLSRSEILNSNKFSLSKDQEILRSNEPVNIRQIQSDLNSNETIIDYFLSNKTDSAGRDLLIFVITEKQINFLRTHLDPSFNNTVIRTKQILGRYALQESKAHDFDSLTSELFYYYDKLIKPAESFFSGKKLIVIPDDEICYLSFDSFLSEKPVQGQADFSSLEYLIKKYTISYGLSAAFIAGYNKKIPEKITVNSFSADYRNGTAGSLINRKTLGGTGTETAALFRWFKGKQFSGSNSTESNFKSLIDTPAVFHMSMHSYQDSVNSKYSYLLFGNGNDKTEDGKLYNSEIETMRVNSPMVVLSACNTGTGTLKPGEGLMSLSRGFVLAGAESVVLTNWEINDITSSAVMTDFYRWLSKGKDKDEALRRAKIDYLKKSSDIYSNPYYWAGYQVLGNKSALAKNNTLIIVVAGLFGILMLFTAARYFKLFRIFRAR